MPKKNPISLPVPLRQKVLLAILGVFLSFVFFEIILRLAGFVLLSLQEHRNLRSIWQKGAYRIMCLGESTTAFRGNDSYSSQLEQVLNEQNIGVKFSVINKGIAGINTSYIISHLEENLNRYKPDMVITMMGINDIVEYLPYNEQQPSKAALFFKSFRIYKLAKLMCLHIIAKLKESGIYRFGGNNIFTKLWVIFSGVTLKGHRNNQINFIQREELLKENLEPDTEKERLHTGLGWFYRERGDHINVEEAFKKALALNPRNDWAYIGLGWFYRDQKRYNKVEELFKKAVDANPKNDWAYIWLARCYIDEKKHDQAEESFKKALELNPKNDFAYDGLVLVYEQMGKYEHAQEYYKKADKIRLDYYNPMTRNNYRKLKEVLDKYWIKLICVQYPMRSIEPLKKIFENQKALSL